MKRWNHGCTSDLTHLRVLSHLLPIVNKLIYMIPAWLMEVQVDIVLQPTELSLE